MPNVYKTTSNNDWYKSLIVTGPYSYSNITDTWKNGIIHLFAPNVGQDLFLAAIIVLGKVGLPCKVAQGLN